MSHLFECATSRPTKRFGAALAVFSHQRQFIRVGITLLLRNIFGELFNFRRIDESTLNALGCAFARKEHIATTNEIVRARLV